MATAFPISSDEFEPAAHLPYLADVARIERAWTEAYHAAEAHPLDPAAFAALAPEELPAIGLRSTLQRVSSGRNFRSSRSGR